MSSEIFRIANQLQQQGKTPSVALVKAKLSSPMAMPQIIQALQAWKQNPALGTDIPEPQAGEAPSAETDDLARLEAKVDELSAKLDTVLALLNERK